MVKRNRTFLDCEPASVLELTHILRHVLRPGLNCVVGASDNGVARPLYAQMLGFNRGKFILGNDGLCAVVGLILMVLRVFCLFFVHLL